MDGCEYTALDRDDSRPGLPLSLQDMCMLCIMLRLEEFPTDSLALLPSAIRRRLFLGLAHADLLHVDTEVLFGDLNYSGLDPSRVGWSQQRGPVFAREELLDVILHGSTPSTLFSLNLGAALDCYQSVKSTPWRGGEFDLIEHICQCYPSLEPTIIVPLYYKNDVVLPKRFLQFVDLRWKYLIISESFTTYEIQVPLELARPLLQYCKMQRAPPNLQIDCFSFQKTVLWEKFLEDCDRLRNKSPIEMMDPVIPFLQEFLSSVEVLELGADSIDNRLYETIYIILYNTVASSQPRLKHLKIHEIPFLTDCGLELTFERFLKTNFNLLSVYELCTSVPLASSLPNPYPLEGLSVLATHWTYAHDTHAQSLASKLQSLVALHMHTLKYITIQGIGFQYTNNSIDDRDFDGDRVEIVDVPAFATLLSSSFTQLLKQPQFRDLSVGESPLSGACALIKTFLTTPAYHEQTLCVEGLDEQDLMEREEDEYNSNEKKLPESVESHLTWSLNISFFPETNAQFKSLDLGYSSSCIHSLLFSLPKLKLKKLRMRTQDMTLVPAGTAIKVEHVVFSTQTRTSYKPTIFPAHLEKFIISNPILKRLEFEHPTDECVPGLIPALIHCLSKLCQQGRGLDELVLLDSIKCFDDVDIRKFFTTIRHISHQHGTTLVLTLSRRCRHLFSWSKSSLFVDLGKDFQETKIKKIVCNMKDRHTDPRPQLSPLAEEVVVNYRSFFYTATGRKCYL